MNASLRTLKRTPTFAITAILTLVLGIAAAGSMAAVVYGVLLTPLPYGEPDRLVRIALHTNEGGDVQQPPALYFTYREHATQFSDLGFYRSGSANLRTEAVDDAAERVTVTWLTESMLPLLQVPPMLGRNFTTAEVQPGGVTTAILSEAEWRSRFGAAIDVLGRTILVNDVPREIVGVMPAGFAFPSADTRIWLSARLPTDPVVAEFSYSGIGRLRSGVNPAQAEQELSALLPRMAEAFPRLETGGATAAWLTEARPKPRVQPLREAFTADIAHTLWALAAAAALVLLVAWANVANLMLIRADARQNELAVRATLGAGRLRIATHFLGESLWLGAIAGTLALLLTYAAVRALVAFGPHDVPRLSELGVGVASVAFIALISLLSVGLCATVPTLRLRRASLSSHLRDGARDASAGKTRQRLRMGIAALQIALALVVSLGSALLLRTAHRLHEVHPGFDADDVTIAWTLLPYARYDDAAAVAFYARLGERVRALPSVAAAGLTMRVPLAPGWSLRESFRVEGDSRTPTLPVHVVDAGYFAAMRIPLLVGTGFKPIGTAPTRDIAISQSAAATLFGDASGAAALGKHLTLAAGGPPYTIVGVVGDVRELDLATAPSAMIYRPQALPADANVEGRPPHAMALVVKSKLSPDMLVPAIRGIVHELDPTVPIFNVGSMDDVVRASTARLSLTLTLVTAAAAITLLLGAIGLYGVMAYMVALRTREFGVRVAVGANPARIAALVASRGLALTAGGILAGFGLYAMATPYLDAFLYEVTPTDPTTLAASTLVLIVTAGLACSLPARRAARIDPAEALRAE